MHDLTNEVKTAINVLIIDDEREACRNLQNILAQYAPSLRVAGIAHDTKEAEQLIAKLQPQAIFLDINMPHENAFHFLERTAPASFEVIFVTAYDEYAIRALKLNAIDYILKPISANEIEIAAGKLTERLNYRSLIKQNVVSYNELSIQAENKLMPSKITLKDYNTIEIVDFKDIYYIEAKGSYAHIVFKKGSTEKSMMMSHSISEYEELMPPGMFFRIHKSYLVNWLYVQDVSKENNYSVSVAGKFTLPVGRRRYADMMAFLKSNTFSKRTLAAK